MGSNLWQNQQIGTIERAAERRGANDVSAMSEVGGRAPAALFPRESENRRDIFLDFGTSYFKSWTMTSPYADHGSKLSTIFQGHGCHGLGYDFMIYGGPAESPVKNGGFFLSARLSAIPNWWFRWPIHCRSAPSIRRTACWRSPRSLKNAVIQLQI